MKIGTYLFTDKHHSCMSHSRIHTVYRDEIGLFVMCKHHTPHYLSLDEIDGHYVGYRLG